MFGLSNLSRAMLFALFAGLLAAGLTLPLPAQAQTQETEADDEQVVVVTGSRIRRIEQEGPSPVVVITAEDMDNRGYNTVLEALNDLSQNAGGGIDQQNTFGFVPSASAIDLRGFGVGRTLVLIDGRRVPVFPIADGGTTNFVDLSSIPAVAIDRVEVLTDGASAIYGSDAVSGVINVILKKDAEDAISLRRSSTTEGGGGQSRAQLSTGITGSDGSNASVFIEYYKQDVLAFGDRSYSRSDVIPTADPAADLGIFSSFGDPGTLFDPSTGDAVPAANCGSVGVIGPFCRFNRAPFRELFPEMRRYSLTGKYDRPIGENLSSFARVTYLNSQVETQIEPMALDMAADLGIALTADAPNNPTNPLVDTSGTYAGLNIPGAFRRRLVEFGPRSEKIDNDTIHAVVGVRGSFGSGYEWESGAGYSEQRVTGLSTGFARKDAFATALCGTAGPDADGFCNSGTLNLFEPIPDDLVAQFSTQPRTDAKSSITSLDFQVNGDLFDMPNGAAKVAVVAEFNKQSFADERDPDVLSGNVIALGGTAGGGERKYYAAGIEVEVPLLTTLSINLAGRYDKYDDDSRVGGAFSPRIGIEYRPIQSLLVRGAAGKSFRAPDLQRLFGAEVAGFTDLIDSPTCVALGGQKGESLNLPDPDDFDACTDLVQSTEVREGANRDLKEETGNNFSAGVVWEAMPGLTLSVDAFYIELNDIVNTPDLQTILDKNAASGDFADAIVYDPAAVSAINPGGLDLVSAQARNLSLQRTRGVDVEGEYRWAIGNAGDLQFTINGTYVDQLDIRESAGDPLVDILQDGTLAEEVRFKGSAKVNWTRGPVGTTAFVNYIGPFATFFPEVQERVSSWTTVNLSGFYDLPWNGRIQIGMNNIFDKDPPLYSALGDGSQPFYSQFFHDPYGSSWFVNYSQKF